MSMYKENYNETDFQKELIALPHADFDKKICERFPEFFVNRDKTMQESCMYWGFEMGPGWRPVLWELCEKLEVLTKPYNLILHFDQIKEKYGSLRAYYSIQNLKPEYKLVDDMISDLVNEYEDKCNHICAISGKYYEDKIGDRWIYDICFEEFAKKYADHPHMVDKVKANIICNRQLKYITDKLISRHVVKDFIGVLAKQEILNQYLDEKEIAELVEMALY